MSWRDELAKARADIGAAAERKRAQEKARLAGTGYEPETSVTPYAELYEPDLMTEDE